MSVGRWVNGIHPGFESRAPTTAGFVSLAKTEGKTMAYSIFYTHPETGRVHEESFGSQVSVSAAVFSLVSDATDERYRTISDNPTVNLVKAYVGPSWYELSQWLQVVRDQFDKDRVEGAIRDASRDYGTGDVTPERLSLVMYLGQCQPAVEWRHSEI